MADPYPLTFFPAVSGFLNSLDRSLARAAMSAIEPNFSAVRAGSPFSRASCVAEHFFQRGRSDEGAKAAHGVGEHDSMTGTKAKRLPGVERARRG